SDVNQPPRPLHQRRLRGIFLSVASTPPWEGGDFAIKCAPKERRNEFTQGIPRYWRGRGRMADGKAIRGPISGCGWMDIEKSFRFDSDEGRIASGTHPGLPCQNR